MMTRSLSRLSSTARAAGRWVRIHWAIIAVLAGLLLAARHLREWELARVNGPIIHLSPDGVLERRYEDGTIESRVTTFRGLYHGPFEQWWQSGRVSCLGYYSAGEQIGPWHWFSEAGELVKHKEIGRE
jgi:hypothetical protein